MKHYLKTKNGILYHGDCLDVIPYLAKKNIKFDLILTDPPYNITQCNWDFIIPLEKIWSNLNNVINDNTPICLFGNEPFSSKLRLSNLKNFKYDWYWNKKIPSGMGFAKFQPMRQIENISIFYKCNKFYPQMILRDKPQKAGGFKISDINGPKTGLKYALRKTYKYKYPINILKYMKCRSNGTLHPTQKPVDLYKYLIKTYTKENDLILDFCAGSGTLAIACHDLNRKYIMIEKELKYCEITKKRMIDNNINIISNKIKLKKRR